MAEYTCNKEYIEFWIHETKEEIFDMLLTEWNEDVYDLCFQAVDSGWHSLGFVNGMITEWPVVPIVGDIMRSAVILAKCQEYQYVETDSGLWDGLNPGAALGSQAFFSLVQVLYQCVHQKLLMWKADHACCECKNTTCAECNYNLMWEYD